MLSFAKDEDESLVQESPRPIVLRSLVRSRIT